MADISVRRRPLLIVVSAPSGAGKTTLCDRLLSERKDIAYSISCTTRKRRGNEVDGRDYHFLGKTEFDRLIKEGEFLEHASVHGNMYGTLRRSVLEPLLNGLSVLMDIDVQGAGQIRESLADSPEDDLLRRGFVDIFVMPPSVDELRQRLESRGEDSPETIAERIKNAESEMAEAKSYTYVVVNRDLEEAYDEFRRIIEGEQKRTVS